jgi:hypothetical protein
VTLPFLSKGDVVASVSADREVDVAALVRSKVPFGEERLF